MNLQEIKSAVSNDKDVFCGSLAYKVIKDKNNEYLIKCTLNGSCIGLTWADGETLNAKEEDFFYRAKRKQSTYSRNTTNSRAI